MVKLIKYVGAFLIVIAVLLFMAAINIHKNPDLYQLNYVAVYISSLFFYSIGIFLWRRSKRVLAKKQKKIDLNTDKIVLYLRPFIEDEKRMKTFSSYLLYPTLPVNLATQEENLARMVKQYGILTAIGNPEELLPYLGAKRLFFKDYEWKDVVLFALEKAKLIILRAGETQGFKWELEQVMSFADRRKVMILMPGNENEYIRVSELIKKVSQLDLPEFSFKWFGSNDIHCIVYFDKQKLVKFYYPKLFYFQITRFDPNAYAIKKCLKQRQTLIN